MLKIGEFSKLSGVSVRMLRHYDEIGLLKPAETDRFTDYRYYREDQLPKVCRITALKDMGFSLADIVRILDIYVDKVLRGKAYLRGEIGTALFFETKKPNAAFLTKSPRPYRRKPNENPKIRTKSRTDGYFGKSERGLRCKNNGIQNSNPQMHTPLLCRRICEKTKNPHDISRTADTMACVLTCLREFIVCFTQNLPNNV